MKYRKLVISFVVIAFLANFAACDRDNKTWPDADEQETSSASSQENDSAETPFILNETLVDHHKIEWDEEALKAEEYRKMEGFRICQSSEDYETYKKLVTALLPGTEDADFPTIPEEWFSGHDLGTLFLTACDSDGTQRFREVSLRDFYVTGEGKAIVFLTLRGVGEYRFPREEIPSLFASFLIPLEKTIGDKILSLEYLGAYPDYWDDWDENSIREAKELLDTKAKELDSWRSIMDIGIMAESNGKERFDPENKAFRFDSEDGLLYDEAYAKTPILVRLQLIPAEGLHSEGIEKVHTAAEWNAQKNREAMAFLADYEIHEIYDPREASQLDILCKGKGRVNLNSDNWDERIPRTAWYVKTTPDVLKEIVKDPRVIRVGA